MVQKLRLKFITTAMLSVLIALVLLTTIINVFNYSNVVNRTDWTVAVLAKNKGTFPESFYKKKEKHKTSDEDIPADSTTDIPSEDANDRSYLFRKQLENDRNDTVSPFETRYFSVVINKNNVIQELETSQAFSIDNATIITLQAKAKRILKANGAKAFIDDYRCTRIQEDAGIRYIFLDCSRSLENFRSFRNISMLIVTIGLMIVFFLLYFTSGRILKPIAESYEKQSRFITDAGHEIRTPLTIINADLSILEMEQEGSEPNEWIEDIKQQTSRLGTLTEELVYLTRMQEAQRNSGKMKLFNLSETIQEAAKSFDARAKVSGKNYHYSIRDAIILRGDQSSIQKLVNILLDNAFKYSTPEGNIYLSLIQSGKNIFLSVENSAEFIDPDSLPHLFDRFYRADSSRNSETGGHGIGLSIAQAVVEAHDGHIAAYASDTHSLKITATLPLKH